MKKCKVLDCIAMILLIIGAINWGLVGLFDLNLVTLIFGKVLILVKVTYLLVGLAGIYGILLLLKCGCK